MAGTRTPTLILLTFSLSVCWCIALQPVSADRVLHREKSLYQNIIVTENRQQRCLAFSSKRVRKRQTCINLKDEKKIVFHYVRMSLAGLLINPDPKRMLMIGLGGGTISTVLAGLFPDMTMDIVELDPAVVRVARDYFNFREPPGATVHVQDGRVFTRRALLLLQQKLQAPPYDLIILDAFTGEYIPEHLMTKEFLLDVKGLLGPGGVVVANTFSTSELYDHESVTYHAVFGDFLNFKRPGTSNRVIVATAQELPDDETMAQNAGLLAPRLADYSVKIASFPGYLSRDRDWDQSKRVLTDQFAPVNLLRGKSAE